MDPWSISRRKWPDIIIFCNALKHYLDKHERVEADDEYRGEHQER